MTKHPRDPAIIEIPIAAIIGLMIKSSTKILALYM